ncbi:MAG: hypothetical protein M1834_008670 [Cirrosporium novae-zelandiae]|nr:MAG: hypothetical protein M1834_008670 [Cirrosporium novae-zelandiae]
MARLPFFPQCSCSKSAASLSSPFLLLYYFLPASSYAQLLTTTSTRSSTHPSITLTTLSTSIKATQSQPNSTSFQTSPSSTPTSHSSDPGDNPASELDDPETRTTTTIVNYYFLLLFLLIAILLATYFYLRRRRHLKIERSQSIRHTALLQDVQNRPPPTYGNGHRWRWMNLVRRNREEGLNERGEAPPPYTPPRTPAEPERAYTRDGQASLANSEVIPLRILDMDITKPPDYREAISDVPPTSQYGSTSDSTSRLNNPVYGEGTSDNLGEMGRSGQNNQLNGGER